MTYQTLRNINKITNVMAKAKDPDFKRIRKNKIEKLYRKEDIR